MKKIPVRNYFCLLVIVVVTVFVVINVATMYKLSKRVETEFYTYSNNISGKEFENYITEYPDSIIYIYDKYSKEYEEFEKTLREKIDNSYFKNNFVYIDKRDLNKKFLKQLEENYNVELKYNNKPIIMIVEDKEIKKITEIDKEYEISKLEVFE